MYTGQRYLLEVKKKAVLKILAPPAVSVIAAGFSFEFSFFFMCVYLLVYLKKNVLDFFAPKYLFGKKKIWLILHVCFFLLHSN